MIKKFGFAIYDLYNFFFDLKINPLRHIPSPYTQFIMMFYLSVMCTAIFTFWAGYTLYWGIYSVGGHLVVIGGFFITAMTFQDAEKNGHLWVQRVPEPDRKRNKTIWNLENES
jgi:hypothetical protein